MAEKMKKTQQIAMTAVMAALIFVVTFLVKFPVPVSGGAYLNFGDVAIYICAYLLGGPLTAAAAAIGSFLADLAVGSAVYAVPTLIIKGVMGLAAGIIAKKHTFGFYILACAAGGAIMVFGYALFEYFFFDPAMAAASMPFNLIQWGGSVAVAALLYPALRPMEHALLSMRKR